jgi:hypothetical protein
MIDLTPHGRPAAMGENVATVQATELSQAAWTVFTGIPEGLAGRDLAKGPLLCIVVPGGIFVGSRLSRGFEP